METAHRTELAVFFELAFYDPDRARMNPQGFENVVLYFMFAAPWLRKKNPNDKRLEVELSAFLDKYSSFVPASHCHLDIAYASYRSRVEKERGRPPSKLPIYDHFRLGAYPHLSKLAEEAVDDFAPWKCFCGVRYSRMDGLCRHIETVSVNYTQFDTGHGWNKFANDPVRAILAVMPHSSTSEWDVAGPHFPATPR